jgi:hypothetical protein
MPLPLLAVSIALSTIFAVSASAQRSPEELEARLKEVERERDALKQKVAQLQLEILKLKEGAAKSADGAAADAKEDPSRKHNQWKAKFIASVPITADDIRSRIFAQERVVSDVDFDLIRAKSDLKLAEFRANRSTATPGDKAAVGPKRAAVTKYELALKAERAKLEELQQEQAESGKTFHVTFEEIGSGKVITFLAKGSIVASLDALVGGDTYSIEGRRRDADTVLLTKVTIEK